MRRIDEMLNGGDKAQVAELVDALASGAGVSLTVRRFVSGLLSLQNKWLKIFESRWQLSFPKKSPKTTG